MNDKRGKLSFIILAYVYWPLAHFAIYMPFIVPNLERWNHIPYWIPIVLGLGFVFVLVNLGMRLSTKMNCFHSIGIVVFLHFFSFWIAKLAMPGFKKYEIDFLGTYFAKDLIAFLLPIACFFTIAEGSRVILRLRNVKQ